MRIKAERHKLTKKSKEIYPGYFLDGKKCFVPIRIAVLLAAAFLALIVSCAKTGELPGGETIPATGVEDGPAGGSVSSRQSGAAGEGDHEAILIRGNYWSSGISGFDPNGFPALAGEYRLGAFSPEAPAPSPSKETGYAEPVFSVCFTREPLFFSDEWQARPGTPGIPVFQRSGEDGYLAAVLLDDSRGASWIAVFRFPRGLEAAGLNAGTFDRMLQAWVRRTSYFLSLSKSVEELSLPATVEF